MMINVILIILNDVYSLHREWLKMTWCTMPDSMMIPWWWDVMWC